MPTIDYRLMDAPIDVWERDRWTVLTFMLLHANIRNRCWPSMRRIAKHLHRSLPYVTDAKKWLVEHKAIRPVPKKERVEDERAVHQRQNIYELTGKFIINGNSYPYLYIPLKNGDNDQRGESFKTGNDQSGESLTTLILTESKDIGNTTKSNIVPPSATPKKSAPSKKVEKSLLTGMRTPTPIRVPTASPKLPPPPKPVAKPVPKPTPKPTQKKSRKPQPSDVLWNAIADCFFDGARVGNQRLGRILHGQDSHGLFGLIAFECEHQNTQTLDFEMLAFLVPKFKESLPDDPKRTDSRGKPMKLELRDPAKFIERWIGWRCTTPNGHTSEPPMMNYDPACPHGCDKGIVYFTDEKGQTATRYCTCRVKILEARKGRVFNG